MATRRSTRSRSQSLEPEEQTYTTSSSRRATRSRMSLSARNARSIAETDQEATAEEEEEGDESSGSSSGGSPSGSSEGEGERSRSKHTQQQQQRYSFSSSSTFTRSPYITRSSSKTRSNAPSLTAAAGAASRRGLLSPTTRTLSFIEGEEEEESSDSAAATPVQRSALKARFASGGSRGTPGTPGERFAHDDAGVYQQDVCDSHEVHMPDGSVVHRPHDCGSRHAHTYSTGSRLASASAASTYRPRQWSPSPESAAAAKRSASKRLGLYMLLTMLMLGLLGPWALKQLTSRPPSFVQQAGRDGALMTQAELDQIIEHVRDSVRADLASKQLVDQHGLEQATTTLAEHIEAARTRYVTTSVAQAVRDVYSKMDARMQSEGERDAAALAALRKEVLEAMEARTTSSAREWSQRVRDEFTAALQGESAERREALQQLLVQFTTRADKDRAESLEARQSLRSSVLVEVETLLQAERSARETGLADVRAASVTAAQVESMLADLIRAENEEDAATLAAALKQVRAEFESMWEEKLERRLGEWEGALRAQIMAQAHESFAPLSAVLATPASADGGDTAPAPVNEEALVARLKAHLVLLVSQIELPAPKEPKEPREPKEPKEPKEPREPREVDEAALEKRLAARMNERVDDLAAAQQRSLDAAVEGQVESLLQRALSSLRTELPNIIAPLIPVPEPAPVPEPVPDHSGAIQELYSQVESLKAELQAAREAAALATQRQQERELQWQQQQEEREKATAAKAAEAAAEAAATAAAVAAASIPAVDPAVGEAERAHIRQVVLEQKDARKRMDELAQQLQLAQAEAEAARQAAQAAATAAAVEPVVASGPDYSHELAALQGQISALNAAMAAAAQAAASAPVSPDHVAAPAAEDHSGALAALHESIATLRAEMERAQSEEAARLRERDAALLKEATDAASAAAAAAVAALPIPSVATASSGGDGGVSSAVVSREIERALERYSADRTERVDYALRSSGAKVIAASPGHQVPLEGNALTRLFKRCFLATKKPEEMFNDNMSVGQCWPMNSTAGFVSVRLRSSIVPTHVSLQHVSFHVSPDHTTAPREFAVYGVRREDEARVAAIGTGTDARTAAAALAHPIGTLLGRFTYAFGADTSQLQTFPLTHPNPAAPHAYSVLTVAFLSNYGNPGYTCIYRVRVHGQPADDDATILA